MADPVDMTAEGVVSPYKDGVSAEERLAQAHRELRDVLYRDLKYRGFTPPAGDSPFDARGFSWAGTWSREPSNSVPVIHKPRTTRPGEPYMPGGDFERGNDVTDMPRFLSADQFAYDMEMARKAQSENPKAAPVIKAKMDEIQALYGQARMEALDRTRAMPKEPDYRGAAQSHANAMETIKRQK